MGRLLPLALALMLALSLSIAPATAAGVAEDAGASVGGVIFASQVPDSNWCPTGYGGGLGIPLLNRIKKVFYRLHAMGPSLQGPMEIDICGQFDPVLGEGAACGMMSSYNGHGTITAGTGAVAVSGLGWTSSVGDVVAAHGTVSDAAGQKSAGIVMLMHITGPAWFCASKRDGTPGSLNEGGAHMLLVDLAYVLGNSVPQGEYTK